MKIEKHQQRIQFLTNPLRIDDIRKKFGETVARGYFQEHFKKPESILQFASLFRGYLQNLTPVFHDEMLEEALYGLFIDREYGTRFGFGAPRGFAKSSVFNVIFNAWCALNGYFKFIIPISDTHNQAKLHLGALKAELESNPVLNWIYPDLKGRVWGEERIVINSLKGEVLILPLGAGMQIRGLRFKQYRPQLVVIDDLENLEQVYSKDRRNKLRKWFDEDLEPAMDRYNKNFIFIGTILHYHALLKQVLHNEGKYKSWNTKIYKALQDNGTSLWEERFSLEYLKAIRDDPEHPDYVGSIVFAQEYQNEPQDDKDRIIKMDWIREYNFTREMLNEEGETPEEKRAKYLSKFSLIFAGFDPAISEAEKSDNFSLYVAGLEKDTAREKMFDLKTGKEPDINKQVTLICDAVQEWKIEVLGIESVAFQKGLYNLVKAELNKRGVYITIKEIKTDKDKIRRARIHSSSFEGGFIYLRTDVASYSIIRSEIEEFPLGEHDDTFDSLMLSREARANPNQARVFAKKPTGL